MLPWHPSSSISCASARTSKEPGTGASPAVGRSVLFWRFYEQALGGAGDDRLHFLNLHKDAFSKDLSIFQRLLSRPVWDWSGEVDKSPSLRLYRMLCGLIPAHRDYSMSSANGNRGNIVYKRQIRRRHHIPTSSLSGVNQVDNVERGCRKGAGGLAERGG